jgi:hypothetical protein
MSVIRPYQSAKAADHAFRLPAASPRAQIKSRFATRGKTTRRANQQNLSSPPRKNISLNLSGKSVI